MKSFVLLKQQLIDEQRKHVSEVRVLAAEREEVQKQKEGISSTMRQSWTSQQATLEEELRVERERARELALRLQHEGVPGILVRGLTMLDPLGSWPRCKPC